MSLYSWIRLRTAKCGCVLQNTSLYFKNLGKTAEAYKLAHRSGLKFANYLNDRRFSQEFATLKRIYYELSDEHAGENDKDPFVN